MAGTSTGGSLIDDAKLKQLYATMLRCRLLTEHGRRLPRSRTLFDTSLGQEAIAAGCAIDLRPQDTVAVASHDSILSLVKGVALSDVVARMYGRLSTVGWGAQNIIGAASRTASGQGELYTAAGNVALASKREDNGNVVVRRPRLQSHGARRSKSLPGAVCPSFLSLKTIRGRPLKPKTVWGSSP
jgi:TPP-dependent pyruvate/acetoin dehydrogenase alpha subunit